MTQMVSCGGDLSWTEPESERREVLQSMYYSSIISTKWGPLVPTLNNLCSGSGQTDSQEGGSMPVD